jgi:hypothetical protein
MHHSKCVGTIARFDQGSLNVIRAERLWSYLLPSAFHKFLEIDRSTRFHLGRFYKGAGAVHSSLLRVGRRKQQGAPQRPRNGTMREGGLGWTTCFERSVVVCEMFGYFSLY